MFRLPADLVRSIFGPLAKVANPRATLPVLAHLHLQRRDHQLVVTAADLDRWLTIAVDLEPAPITALGRTMAELRWKRAAGPILVPAGILRDALKAARTGHISIDAESLSYELAGNEVRLGFDAFDPEQFPSAPEVAPAHFATLNAETRGALVAANNFDSEDETRFVLNGVYLEPSPLPSIVATDGRRLYRHFAPALAMLDGAAVIPSETVALLGHAALLSHDWRLGVNAVGESPATHAVIEAGPWRLVTTTIEGNFPNYRQVIPSDLTDRAAVTITQPLQQQLEHILKNLPAPKKPEQNCLTLQFHADHLTLLYPALKSSITVPGVRCEVPIAIAFNRDFLEETIALGAGTLFLGTGVDPAVYRTASDAFSEMVLMPMRLGNDAPSMPDPALEAATLQWLDAFVETAHGAEKVTRVYRSGRQILAAVGDQSIPVTQLVACPEPPKAQSPLLKPKPSRRLRREAA